MRCAVRRGDDLNDFDGYVVVRSQLVTRPLPESEAQRREREAQRLPAPVFSFVVESVRPLTAAERR